MTILNTDTLQELTEDALRAQYTQADFAPPYFPFPPYVRVQPTDAPSVDALTHEAVQGAPALVDGSWAQTWAVVALAGDVAAARLAAEKLSACLSIDADADAIYGAVQGNRIEEYRTAEAEALTYRAAGYAGTVPPSVAGWASAKGWTATQAADDILATAAAWRGAQAAIRAARLARKEQVRAATDAAGIAAALAAWGAFRAGVRAQLGLGA